MLQRHRFVPFLRSLETRLAPATFTVTSLLNAGPGTLRVCIQSANSSAGADTVDFAPGLVGTIMLTGGDIAINDDVAIVGPGAKLITVNGAGVGRAFSFLPAPSASVHSIIGLTIAGGKTSGNGGAIQIGDETLTLNDCAITGNSATGNGGGVYMAGDGRLIVSNCTLSGNTATDGGGIYIGGAAGVLQVDQSTLSGNFAGFNGGAIADESSGSALSIRNSTITGNAAFATTGGVFADNSISIDVESCIVAGNTSGLGAPDFFANKLNAEVSAIGSKSGIGVFTADSVTLALLGQNFKLGGLADNGGPLLTHLPASDSPVRDQGSIGSDTVDQRGPGFPRKWNSIADIGSVELAPIFVVRNDNNIGPDCLRQQVLDANDFVGQDVITFDAAAFATTDDVITLTSGEIAITEGVTIQGPGARLAAISGNDLSRIFNLTGAPAGSVVAVSFLSMTGGKTTGGGGAVLVADETLVLTGCAISGNSATSNSGGGGVTVNNAGAITINDCTFAGNVAAFGGAIHFSNTGGSLTITNCTLAGNSATTSAGAIYFLGGSGTGVAIRNSTITNNSATGAAGGIFFNSNNASALLLENAVVAGNSAPSSADIATSFIATVTANFCALSFDNSIATFVPDAQTTALQGQNFKLGTLANNGGPTDTILPTVISSPLVNAGSNPGALTNDQRGAGFGRQRGAGIDIGAVEYPSNFVVTNTLSTGPGSLRQAVTDADAFTGYDQITFDPTVFKSASTIALGSAIAIDDTVIINGTGATLLTINAAKNGRVFNTAGAPAGAKVVISGMTLTNGAVVGNGGAIYIGDEQVFIDNCRIAGNTASASGGAIFVADGQVFVSSTSIANNEAMDGGGIYQLAGDLTLSADTFSGNIAKNLGAGLAYEGADDLLVLNSTFSGNTAANGGGGIGLVNVTGKINCYNSTLTLNAALMGGFGGGICRASGTSTIFVDSTILSGNAAPTGPDAYTTGVLDAGFSLLGTAAGIGFPIGDAKSTSLLGKAPNLGSLADLGGPTLTHYLLPGSPAISNGSNLLALQDDQRGKPRTVGTVDIGAVELAPAHVASVVVGDGTNQRSIVMQIKVTFDETVTFAGAPAAAFTLVRSTPLPIAGVTLAAAVDNSGPTTIVTLTFTGGSVDGKSLADGRYNLNVLSGQFAGEGFDGNGDGVAGDDYGVIGDPAVAPKLFRFFGDADGDGAVAANDFIEFRLALGGTNPIFDFDGDGAVAASDFIQFRLRFGGSI